MSKVPQPPAPEAPLDAERERREQRRIDALGQIEVRATRKAQPLTLRELSAAGLSLEATAPFAIGSFHEFHLTFGEGGPAVTIVARATHCMQVGAAGDLPIYLAGFETVVPSEAARRRIGSLIQYVQDLLGD